MRMTSSPAATRADRWLWFATFGSSVDTPVSKASADRGVLTPTSVSASSADQRLVHRLAQPQQRRDPRVPRQQPVDDLPARSHDLARQLDQAVHEPLEL